MPKTKIPDCPACDQLMAALSNEPDLSRVRKAYPDEIAKLVTELHHRKHLPGGRG
jgi:hypothetical protein